MPINTPEFKKSTLPWPTRALTLSIVFVVLLAGVYFGLRYFNNNLRAQIETINGLIQESINGLPSEKRQEIFKMDARLNNLEKILTNHPYVSKIFGLVERVAHPRVSFKSMEVAISQNSISLSGRADNYTVLAEQLIGVLAVEDVKDAQLKSFGAEELGINFVLEIKFDPSLIK